MTSTYNFYMQECTKDGVLIEGTKKNLEHDFNGLKYSRMDGIETIGATKNIYTETFADSDKQKVYMPKEVTHKPTDITFTVFFLGENRYKVYDEFNAYIGKGLHKYWDDARKKWFIFYVSDEIKPAEQKWHGSEPYLKMSYKLKNIYGMTFDLE